ncbi:MFS transporter [Bacillus taeanensis]|uniref:MFS transporter n=1 Tax=Bacillus taeanensis TaxID=273032 RepID=A0A366XT02_9BACI|nr:MFS transporter [Bacillus taeanensis]RBW69272.1 MFS transporter [Bacillus taeanensis]
MIVSFTAWSIISPIAATVQNIYGLSETEKSFLVVMPVILGSLMRIPMGILADKYGGKKIYTFTMIFLIFPLVGAGFSNSYLSLLFWVFLIGMAGTTFAIAVTYVTRWFLPEKQGLVLGITGMGNLGTAVSSFSVPIIAAQFGLSWTFWGTAIVLMIMVVIFWFGTHESVPKKEAKGFKTSLSVVKFKETWVLSLFYFLTFGGFVAFSFYLPTLLQQNFQLSAVSSGWKVAGFVIIATVVRPLGGYAADRFGAANVLNILFVGISCCAGFISFTNHDFILFSGSCLFMAFLLGLGNGAVFKLVPEVSAANTGAVTGIVSAIGGIGGFFPPLALGIIKDLTGSYSLGFILLLLFALGCLVVNKLSFKSNKSRYIKSLIRTNNNFSR